jgi:hypothetical protein
MLHQERFSYSPAFLVSLFYSSQNLYRRPRSELWKKYKHQWHIFCSKNDATYRDWEERGYCLRWRMAEGQREVALGGEVAFDGLEQ